MPDCALGSEDIDLFETQTILPKTSSFQCNTFSTVFCGILVLKGVSDAWMEKHGEGFVLRHLFMICNAH